MSKIKPQLYFDKVKAYFHGDVERTWMWFKTPNSNLDMMSPIDMMKVGRMNKLAAFIDGALNGKRSWK